VYEVETIFENETTVCMTEEVLDAIIRHDGIRPQDIDLTDLPGGLLKKIEYWSRAGFRKHEGRHGQPIKYEDQGVYRIGYGDLFRIYGFYTDESRKDKFIAIKPWANKRGKKNTSRERAVITEVARVKRDVDWIERESEAEGTSGSGALS
jgi:hypothetical protein